MMASGNVFSGKGADFTLDWVWIEGEHWSNVVRLLLGDLVRVVNVDEK